MNYGCFTHPGPEASETGQGHAAGPANGRYATVLSANPARRAAQLPCIALARYPDRSASGIAYLAFLATMPTSAWPPPGRDLIGAGPAGRAATALPRTNAAARVTLAGVRIPPRD